MHELSVSMTRRELVLGWAWWALQLLFLPALLALLNTLPPQPLSSARLNFLYFCLNFLAVTVLLGRFTLASCRAGLKSPFHTLQSAFFAFGVYYLASFLIGWLITTLAPDHANLNDQSILVLYREEPFLISFGTVLLVPVTEELLYRGLIFGSLYRKSRLAAYGLSTLIFALIHLTGFSLVYDPVHLALSFLQYLPAGLCLGWAYARSGSILAPILMHIAINQIALSAAR